MFEMRYGASTPADQANRLNAKIEIVAADKLANARKTGIRLNLGCGHIPAESYLNVDRRPLPGVDIVAEVDDLPFAEGEIDELYSAHLIEHFPQEQVRRTLLPYWFGLLRPGGTFRAVAPDAQGMMQAYFSGDYPFEQLREVTFGAQDYDGDFHYNMLNATSLTTLLVEAGFVDITLIAENRVNGSCKEFEIAARRPG
jgi:predicted SAM-dependent methyltransferase